MGIIARSFLLPRPVMSLLGNHQLVPQTLKVTIEEDTNGN